MARGKHSTALFEVIHGARKPERAAQSLRTPKWWFKSSHSAAQTAAPAPEPAHHEPETSAAYAEPSETAPPRRSSYSRNEQSSRMKFGFDRGRQEFSFKLRYTTALVSGFEVFMVIGLSYVIGRHLGGGPRVATGSEQPPIRQLLQQPPQPGVIAVTPKTKNVAQPKTALPTTGDASNRAPLANATAPKATVVSSLVPASADTSMPRKVGLNYLVIHIYPPDRKKQAEAARDFFIKNGVPCSLENTSWTGTTGWMTLIGTAGFSRIKTDDFQGYVDQVSKLAKTYKTSQFDHPGTELHAYKWLASDKPS